MTLRLWGAALAVAALAGCAQPTAEMRQQLPAGLSQALPGERAVPKRAWVPPPVPRRPLPALPAPAAVPPPGGGAVLPQVGLHPRQIALPAYIDGPLPVPAYLPPQIGEVMGLRPGGLLGLLGEPRLRWEEGHAEIWQYGGRACVLDIYLEARSGSTQVVHVEARRPDGQHTHPRPCLVALLAARGRALPAGEDPVEPAHQDE